MGAPMEIIVFWLLFCAIAGAIASSKGRGFLPWFFYAMPIPIVTIIWALALKKKPVLSDQRGGAVEDMKKCEHCAEPIRLDAKICRFCNRDVAVVSIVRQEAAEA